MCDRDENTCARKVHSRSLECDHLPRQDRYVSAEITLIHDRRNDMNNVGGSPGHIPLSEDSFLNE